MNEEIHNESKMIEYSWSERYQTVVTRVSKLLCENSQCEKETMALYQLNCTHLCLKCFREWRKDVEIQCDICKKGTHHCFGGDIGCNCDCDSYCGDDEE